MNSRPLIGINADFRSPAKGRAAVCSLPSGYHEALLTAGALPIVLPPLIKEQDLGPILDRLDGIVLTGGDDLDPKKMGLGFHPSVTLMNDRRETADRLLCKLAQERRLPTLGIGVGMQELNVTNGGGLYIHLPEDFPKGIPHRDPQGGPHRHAVTMEPGTMLASIYGPGEICVNSYHHQGIRKLAPNFRVAATAPDGLIEAFEGKDKGWWVVGVQWHPENEGHITLDMQLIETFIQASANYKSVPALAKAG